MEIEQLVKCAAEGDERAWRTLARRIEPKLQRWFASHYAKIDDGDVAQDTLFLVWAKLPSFEMRSESQFMSWVFKIARFKALDALRELEQHERAAGVAPTRKTPTMGLSTRLERANHLKRVRREIERLPKSLRRAAANMLEGGDARELAEEVGLDWGTVRGYESRAIGLLRKRLRPRRRF